jgi:ADP-ribose pyrophosphatase YjhB (NUDIX family)
MNFNFCPDCGTKGSVEQLNETDYRCTNCGWLFWNNAKAATAIAFVKDGQLLIVQRAHEPNKGKYELPGGFVGFGEDAYTGAQREVQEELGIALQREDLRLLETYHNTYNPGITSVDIVFLVTHWQGDFRSTDDVAAYSWRSFSFIYDPDFCQKNYAGLDKVLTAKLK